MDAKAKPPAIAPERAKFVELAQNRMNRAIKAIRLLGQLERRVGWYTADDVESMKATLEMEIATARQRLLRAMEGGPDFQFGAGGVEQT